MDLAGHIWEALRDDSAKIAQIRTWRAQLALDCMDPDQRMEVTSFTFNGQSAAGELPKMTGTKAGLLETMNKFIRNVDNGAAVSRNRATIQF